MTRVYITATTHLTSIKNKKKYVWCSEIKVKDDLYYLFNRLRIDGKTHEKEFLYQSIDDCGLNIHRLLAKFDKCEMKILSFDEEYEEKFIQERFVEWARDPV